MTMGIRTFGIIGDGIDYSLSPAIFNRLFADKKIEAVYQLFNVKPADLETFIASARFLGIAVQIQKHVSVKHKHALLEQVGQFVI